MLVVERPTQRFPFCSNTLPLESPPLVGRQWVESTPAAVEQVAEIRELRYPIEALVELLVRHGLRNLLARDLDGPICDVAAALDFRVPVRMFSLLAVPRDKPFDCFALFIQ